MLEEKAEPSPVTTIRERRRGSISISRVGHYETASMDSSASSTRGSRSSSIILTRHNFYQLDSRRADSTDSFASETTTDPSIDDVEDTHHVAQTHFIPGQSISKAISRRLSRAKDLVPLASPTSARFWAGWRPTWSRPRVWESLKATASGSGVPDATLFAYLERMFLSC